MPTHHQFQNIASDEIMPGTVPDQPVAAPEPAPAADPEFTPEQLQARSKDYIAREKFNRRFTLPASDSHGELTVTYAVAGKDCVSAPTILFIGGLYGGRYLATMADYICEKNGVRFVVADRPGMGGSTPVKPSQRLSVWLETVPALMHVLGAQHVTVGAHSCGVIYALNTVYSMPEILSPTDPRLYLLAPWVSPEHTGISYLSLSSYMPSKVIGGFDSIVRFVVSNVVPTVQFSSGLLSGPSAAPNDSQNELCREFRGISAAEAKAQSDVIQKSLFSEDTSGANDECLLLLKKKEAGPWDACESYQDYPSKLETRLREHFASQPFSTQQSSDPSAPATSALQERLAVKVFWAESDRLIGRKGATYFDKCFEKFTQEGHKSGADSTVLLYDSEVLPKTDHDTVLLPEFGALPQMIKDIVGPK